MHWCTSDHRRVEYVKECGSNFARFSKTRMDTVPANWAAFCVFALIVGARHGLDGDHLATIDSLTRYNGRDDPRLGRLAGLCFSLGHGAVVVCVALIAAMLAGRWTTPHWLD